MSNFMPFVPSDLSANAQPPENAVNEQTDRWTDRQTNNNIHKHPWMLSVSHLDTSACQIVGHFFQALCMQYTNPSPWMAGRTDERMKWQQYPLASMMAKGKSSGNICISNSMPFLPSDLSANVQQDRRWNADKPSAALDPYIPTWLTTSPANHRPANFWFFFFFYIQRKLWKVVQPQVQLMSINFKFEVPILWLFQVQIKIIYWGSL